MSVAKESWAGAGQTIRRRKGAPERASVADADVVKVIDAANKYGKGLVTLYLIAEELRFRHPVAATAFRVEMFARGFVRQVGRMWFLTPAANEWRAAR